MSREHILIGVEGNHDQAFLVKVMCKLLGFSKCEELSNLEPIWKKFIPLDLYESGSWGPGDQLLAEGHEWQTK